MVMGIARLGGESDISATYDLAQVKDIKTTIISSLTDSNNQSHSESSVLNVLEFSES